MRGRSPDWLTAAQIASEGLPDLPATERRVIEFAKRNGWENPRHEGVWWRQRKGRGGGLEYHVRVLPPAARVALAVRGQADEARERGLSHSANGRTEAWEFFDRLSDKKRQVALARLEAIDAVDTLRRSGMPSAAAVTAVAASKGFAKSSFYEWRDRVRGFEHYDWLPELAPRHAPLKGPLLAISDDAWHFIKTDWLRLERPSFRACWRRLQMAAATHGWTMPTERTVERRLMALPVETRVLMREGQEALKRLYPPQQRTRGHFHALQAVNADGHKFDVFVKWQDGTVGRALMLAFQDLYSGKILSWRVDRSENKEATRLAFGDLVEEFGIPDKCWLDNGRQFASKWISGGSANRYRFKIRDEEPLGLLTQMGVEVHWTTPYSGQSKPIERAFRDLCDDIAKHPAFAGAWTGNNPLAKPENYASAAVPIETFLRVVGEGIIEHNARPGRRSAVCAGRSFDAVFAESYARSVIRRCTEHQRRLWLLAAESVRCASRDGAIELLGNRYWQPELTALRGQRVTARFDPQALHGELHVYRQADGAFLFRAPCVQAAGFDDIAAAQAHNRARRAWMRGVKLQADAEVSMSIDQVAALLPQPERPSAPETKVVRLTRGNTALAVAEPVSEQSPEEIAMLRALAHQRPLRIVPPQNGEAE